MQFGFALNTEVTFVQTVLVKNHACKAHPLYNWQQQNPLHTPQGQKQLPLPLNSLLHRQLLW